MSNLTTVCGAVLVLCVLGAMAGFQVGRTVGSRGVDLSEQGEGTLPFLPELGQEVSGRPSMTPEEIAEGIKNAVAQRDREGWLAMGERISDLNKSELLAVLAELGEMENEQLRLEARMPVFRRLAELDPPQAVEEAIKFPYTGELDRMLGSALGNWAKLSPEVALGKARELAAKFPRGEYSYLGAVFREWAQEDFKSAFAMVKSLQNRREIEIAISGLSGVVGADGELRIRLLEIASAFSDAKQGRRFVESSVRRWAQTGERDEIAEWIEEQELEADQRSELLRAVAEGAGNRDPKRTADWLLARSTEESRAEDLKTAVSSWAPAQPDACGQWLESHLHGAESDEAVAHYSGVLARRNVRGALRWAQKIHDGELRNRTLGDVVERMGPIPVERVRQNLESAGLEESLVAQLLEKRGRGHAATTDSQE